MMEELGDPADARAAEEAQHEPESEEDEGIPSDQALREIREGRVAQD
jgi:hypothetical protein